jgi:hypothetical protein
MNDGGVADRAVLFDDARSAGIGVEQSQILDVRIGSDTYRVPVPPQYCSEPHTGPRTQFDVTHDARRRRHITVLANARELAAVGVERHDSGFRRRREPLRDDQLIDDRGSHLLGGGETTRVRGRYLPGLQRRGDRINDGVFPFGKPEVLEH